MNKNIFKLIVGILVIQMLVYLILSLGSLLDFIFYTLNGVQEDFTYLGPLAIEYSDNLAPILSSWSFILALLATVTFFALAYLYDFGTDLGKTWIVIAIGIALWTGGELIWLYYVFIAGEAPYPGLADVSWILGYPVLVFGLVLLNRQIALEISKKALYIYTAVMVVFSSLLLMVLIPPFTTDVEPLEAMVGLFYPIGDLFVLYFAGLIVLKFTADAEIRRSYILIVLSFIITSIGDIFYAFTASLQGIYNYYAFDVADGLFIGGYTLLIVGGLAYYHLVSNVLAD